MNTDTPQPGSDFWPGQFSRTRVGVTRYGYRTVTAGLRAGRVWLNHGYLLDGLDVRLKRDCDLGRGVPLGGRLRVRKGEPLAPNVTVTGASRPNTQRNCPSWRMQTSSGAWCAALRPTGTAGGRPTPRPSTPKT